MDFISFMIVVWFVKVLAEDAYSTVKGTPNPRTERRRQRQRSRSQNRVWGAFTNYLGDVAEDARQEATAGRRRKLAEKARKRELAEREAEEVRQERAELRPHHFVAPASGGPLCAYVYGTDFAFGCGHPRHDPIHVQDAVGDEPVDVDLDDPKQEPKPTPARGNVIPLFPAVKAPTKEEYDMSTAVNSEVTGLDPAISYAESLATFAGEHGQAGNEGYVDYLTISKVAGQALASAHDMQEAFANAAAAAERHKGELEKQKTVQEAYAQNADAGDKEFMQNGQ
jgi:hypothetical protein